MAFEENYTAAEQRVLMFATFLFIGAVEEREGMAKGLATYIANLKTDRDELLAACKSLLETEHGAGPDAYEAAHELARTAIAKAERP